MKMRCHNMMLDLLVLITYLVQALASHCDCDLSLNSCVNIHACYHCEFVSLPTCLKSITLADKESCRTYLSTQPYSRAIYTQATGECKLISNKCNLLLYSATVDVVFIKTCDTASNCTKYTMTKHANAAVTGSGYDSYAVSVSSLTWCMDICLPPTQDCTVSFAASSLTCTVFPTNCGGSCLTASSSGVDVYTITCMKEACPALSDPVNGVVDASDGTSLGAQAVYTCKEGYNLTGSSVVTCNSNGQWNDSTPTCTSAGCGIPGEPQFGSVLYTKTIHGANATYTCDTGYNISEPVSRSCLANGSWELPEPRCVPVDCGPLPNLENGTVHTPGGTTFGETASFTCDEGFVLLPSAPRVCQKDSQWSGSMPSCKSPGETAKKYGLEKLFIMPCICYPNKTFVDLTEEEIIHQLIADIKIEKKDTKLAVSKLISKPDPRVSSKMIGSVAIVVLSVIGGLILCGDIMTIRSNRRALKTK